MSRMGRAALRWAALALALGVAGSVGFRYATDLPSPSVSQTEGRWVLGVAFGLYLCSTYIGFKRVSEDLAGLAHRAGRAGGASAVVGSVRAGSLGAFGAMSAYRATARIVAVASPLLAAGLALVIACYAPTASLGAWSWVVAVGPAALAGWVLATRATAYQHARLNARALGRSLPGLLMGFAAAGAVTWWAWGMLPPHPLAGVAVLIGVTVSGTIAGHGAATQARRKRAVAGQLSASLGCGQSTLTDPAKARWSVSRSGVIKLHKPLPGDIVTTLGSVNSRLSEFMPSHEAISVDPELGIVLVRASPETQARRALMASTAGLVVSMDGDQWSLAPEVRATDGPALAELARSRGLTLTAFNPVRRTATVEPLEVRVVNLRTRVAELVGAGAPWDLAIEAEWHEGGWLAELTITRGGTIAPERSKRRERWREVFEQLSPYRAGTHVAYSEDGPTVTITRAPDPLARTWAINEFVDKFYDSAVAPERSWEQFPAAMGEDGRPVRLSCFHMVGIGQTGSGKGSYLWSVFAGLLPAWRAGLVSVVGVDPKSAEFTWESDTGKTPHGFFDVVVTEPDEWSELIEGVYDEMKRRQKNSGRSFKVSTDNPVVVLAIDELSALKAFDSDKTRATATEKMLLTIASQGRSDGVYLIAAVQQPQKEMLGAMRPYFGYRLALRTESPMETDLVLGTGATEAGAAAHRIPVASAGNGYASAGIAYLTAEEGGGFARIRFPYASDEQLGQWHHECLQLRPREERKQLSVAGAPVGPPLDWSTVEKPQQKPVVEARVEDLEAIELSTEDLDGERAGKSEQAEGELDWSELLGGK